MENSEIFIIKKQQEAWGAAIFATPSSASIKLTKNTDFGK